MFHVALDLALHHRTPVVVLDKAFPPGFGHGWTLGEALLPEVLDRVVVSVSQEIVQIDLLSVVLQPVHQACAVALYLL